MSAVFICAIAEIGCRGSPTSLKVARRTKTKIGICGQAPSDYSDFAEFLVECGIDSISLNPDTVIKTTMAILKTEERIKK